MPQPLKFKTKVSGHTNDGMILRDRKLIDLVKEANFVDTLFLSLTGRQPKPAESKLLNAILVASIDHGINPASGFVPRVVAASGNDVLTSMASTLLALGPYHGGAITNCMDVLAEVESAGNNLESSCRTLVKEFRSDKKRIPGFGHPVYKTEDPRVVLLFKMARDSKLDNKYINIAQMIEHELEEAAGRKLIINVDGAIAALFMTMDIDPIAGNAIFGLARTAGSIAHILEEQKSGKWVRRLDEGDTEYVGSNSETSS
jgi:citrate synthase